MTLAGHELAWGPGGGASEAQGFWAINNGQISIFLYLICRHWQDTIGVGSRGRSPQEIRGFYTLNYRQMSIILYLICDTGRSRIGVGSRGWSPRKLRGSGQ